MRQYNFIAILLFTWLISCDNEIDNHSNYTLKDSVIKDHIQRLDSAIYFDTTDLNFKVLKAYKDNDTIFFKKLRIDIEKERQYKLQWDFEDSCLNQPKLQHLNVDKAYRFIFTAAFCPYKLNVTVSKKSDSTKIHFVIYQYRLDTAICRIINEYDKKITLKEWDDFSFALDKADFWGLKSENGVHGLDGSTLITMGFINADTSFNRPAKFNYVYRWGSTTLSEPFNLILKLSGNKQGCFWIE